MDKEPLRSMKPLVALNRHHANHHPANRRDATRDASNHPHPGPCRVDRQERGADREPERSDVADTNRASGSPTHGRWNYQQTRDVAGNAYFH